MRLLRQLALALAFASPAVAQTGLDQTNFGTGKTPSAAQWNAVFAGKMDYPIANASYTPSTANPGAQPFQVQETVTGTCSVASSPVCRYNLVNIASDNAVVGPNSGSGLGFGFEVIHNAGGAVMTGSRGAGTFNLLLTQTTGNTAPGASYSGLTATAVASANDNGTDTTLANSRGQLETINFVAHLTPSATNWRVLQGGEVDVLVEAGASLYEKVGWQIVQLSGDAVAGATVDAALVVTNASGTVGWKNGILFGGAQGFWPFASTGKAITCDGSCGTLASVLDFGSATITANFLNGPGFSVTGTGAIQSSSATAPSVASGQTEIVGLVANQSLPNASSAIIYVTAASGVTLEGNGSTNDLVLRNNAANAALVIPHSTTHVVVTDYLQTGVTTVAGLPACGAGTKGARYFVTDANANTFHTTAAGGGANNMAVVCDGTNWYLD